ncbi:MAG: hypothetical protein H6607_05795 [Flavobacteriales bacterium]|nr:hypothetical protein [Flavobacteriales bacterium]
MKSTIAIIFFLVLSFQGLCTIIHVEFKIKNKEIADFGLVYVIVQDSLGRSISASNINGKSALLDVSDTLSGKLKLKIEAYGYFPIEIQLSPQTLLQNDSITISNVKLIKSSAKKIPRKAMCAVYAPKEKDIPKKINIKINGKKNILVPNKAGVRDLTYINQTEV